MPTIFNINHVSKIYGKHKETQVVALQDVNLTINKGEFTAIVGASGSGKSTLLNIMSGFDVPTTGEVSLSGKNIALMSGNELSDFRRDHIGFVFQSYNLIPVLTVEENIEYVMMLQQVSKKERVERIARFLLDVGLQGKEKRFPAELSGGQQQRVAIARAMVSQPDIIIADEPTANLDSVTGAELIDMMIRLNSQYGTTFVFSTHDTAIMAKAKRLVTLKDGQIIQDEMKG